MVVLGGDVHANYVADLKADFDDPASPVVATEFCGTSITSLSAGAVAHRRGARLQPAHPLRPRRPARLHALHARREAAAGASCASSTGRSIRRAASHRGALRRRGRAGAAPQPLSAGARQNRPALLGRVEHGARELGHLRVDVARRRRDRLRGPDQAAARDVGDAAVRRVARGDAAAADRRRDADAGTAAAAEADAAEADRESGWLTSCTATATVITNIAFAPASRAAGSSCTSIERSVAISVFGGTKTGVAPRATTSLAS